MEQIAAGNGPINVLFLDNHLLVVEKPPNLPVQADRSGDNDLLSILKRYIGEKFHKPGAVYLGLVHRLDRPVGGVMVFARTSKAASRLSENFRTHAQDRRYLAVVRGVIPAPMEWNNFLLKDGNTGMVTVVDENVPGAKAARLTTTPIAAHNDTTLTEARLFTGRAHQIRVQHAHAGYPLWGDQRYGSEKPGRQIALWAWYLAIEHPTRHETLTFTSRPRGAAIWADYATEIEEWMKKCPATIDPDPRA